MAKHEKEVQGVECGTAFGYWDDCEAVAYPMTAELEARWTPIPRVQIAFLLDDTFENELSEQLDWAEEWYE